MRGFLLLALCIYFCGAAPLGRAEGESGPGYTVTAYGAGPGPSHAKGRFSLVQDAVEGAQNNAVALTARSEAAHDSVRVRLSLGVGEAGEGAWIALLAQERFGRRGPAPCVPDWTAPDLAGSFAIGFDTHNPPTEEPFGPAGNVLGNPQREVSLHWDGREIGKRLSPVEYRGEERAWQLDLQHVAGGAEVTLTVGDTAIFERFFVAGLHAYASRVAFGAGSRAGAEPPGSVVFHSVVVKHGPVAAPQRPPLHVEVFNHVLTDNSKTAFEAEVALPPLAWSYGRVVLTLDIHDAGPSWDEWDRNGEISILGANGERRGIVPFITSYRTPCHWEVDVSHFRPYLAGTTRFEIRAGTTFYKDRGYMMSVSLDFYPEVGTYEAVRVVPLWHGTAHHGSMENHFQDFFEPLEVRIDAPVDRARIFLTTTGHSQVGEFTPAERTLRFAGDPAAKALRPELVVRDRLWREDCYLNPNRPQFGTWKYPRAGWAPGDVVRPLWIDVTEHVVPGATARVTYEAHPYRFDDASQRPSDKEIQKASHVVRAYLILERKADPASAPPTLRVASVAKDSNAATAGLRVGDYLVSYGGMTIDSSEQLREAIARYMAMTATQMAPATQDLIVYRGAERLTLQIAPGRMGVSVGQR